MMKGCEDICAAFVFVLFRQIKFNPVTFQMFSENLYPEYPFVSELRLFARVLWGSMLFNIVFTQLCFQILQ